MHNVNTGADRLFDTVDESDDKKRFHYCGLISAVGVVVASFHIPHFVADVTGEMGLLVLATGVFLPFVLAVSVAIGGYKFWRSDLQVPQIRRVGLWIAFGMVGMTTVSGTFLLYAVIEGAQLPHFYYLLLDFATTGALGGILIGWYDVNNRRHAKQLRVFQQAVEHAGHNIYLTTPTGRIEYANPKFEEQTGYDQDEVIGATPRILKSGEHDETFYEEMWETILAGDVWHSEIVNERKDGSQYHLNQTIAPVTDEDGEIEHFIAINNDITELKEYEARLKRQNEQLDQFASVVSHDLRNPLNVAMGRTEIAKRDCESDHLDAVSQALDRMEQLIADVLSLARQGESVSETETQPLRAVSERAWNQISASEASLSVSYDRAVVADPSRLQQLLENLFRNAIEHGGSEVSIRIGECDDGFYVEDDGTGFTDTDTETLFEPGYTTSDDGTGLGLAIVEQIVDAHGWTIMTTRGTKGGARFEITGVETTAHSELTSN